MNSKFPQTENSQSPSLAFCLTMDAIGMLSYALPALGETIDVVWAPISAYIFKKSFGGKVGTIGGIINFIEELLPYTDVIPIFTIAYFYLKYFDKKDSELSKS